MDREVMLSQILEWSKQAGLTVTRVEDPSADFHVIVSEPNLPPVEILHPEPDSEFVLFATRVVPPEDIQNKLLELSAKQRNELVSEIRLRLLSTNLEFRFVNESGIPSTCELYSKFFPKDNTIQNFWQTYVHMKSVFLFIVFLHKKFLGLT